MNENLNTIPDIKISDSSLSEDIANANYIFGASTSAMIEAASTGKKVFLLEDLLSSGLDYEGVYPINYDKIKDIKKIQSTLKIDENIIFNRDKLKVNFENLIYTLFPKTLDKNLIKD